MTITKKIAIVYSLHQELAAFIRGLKVIDHRTIEKTEFTRCDYQGGDLLLARAGVGGKNVRKSLDRLLELMRPELLILTGFAGAADPVYRTGDVIIPDKVITVDGKEITIKIPSKLLSHLGTTTNTGTMITVPKVYFKKDKEVLRRKYNGKITVDMESGFVAEWALQHQMQLMVIKAVSDPYNFNLPSYQFLIKYFSPRQSIGWATAIFPHPIESYRVIRLAGNCRKAGKKLKEALDIMLPFCYND